MNKFLKRKSNKRLVTRYNDLSAVTEMRQFCKNRRIEKKGSKEGIKRLEKKGSKVIVQQHSGERRLFCTKLVQNTGL